MLQISCQSPSIKQTADLYPRGMVSERLDFAPQNQTLAWWAIPASAPPSSSVLLHHGETGIPHPLLHDGSGFVTPLFFPACFSTCKTSTVPHVSKTREEWQLKSVDLSGFFSLFCIVLQYRKWHMLCLANRIPSHLWCYTDKSSRSDTEWREHTWMEEPF